MNKKELRKAFDDEWKKNEPSKYLVWLVCYIGSMVPILAACFLVLKGFDDDSIVTAGICFVLFFALELVAAIVRRQHEKGWKAYLDAHKNSL